LEYATLSGFEVVGVWKETASGVKYNRTERRQVMALAQSHSIDAILVTEMTRWGRSTIDLIETLQALHSWHVSLIAQTGLQFDLSTPQGRLIAHLMASLAEAAFIFYPNKYQFSFKDMQEFDRGFLLGRSLQVRNLNQGMPLNWDDRRLQVIRRELNLVI
jgi:DNA invertase Pin-like site-specific DNA recombinase